MSQQITPFYTRLLIAALTILSMAAPQAIAGPREPVTSKTLIPSATVDKLLERYSSEEKQLIAQDLTTIRQIVFRGKHPAAPSRKPRYLATAGAPGARKSTTLEHTLTEDPTYHHTVYVDPDQRALRFMAASYLATSLNNYAISKAATYESAQRQAYDHWRDASNYITNTLLNEAFMGGYDIAHGTTMTGPFAGAFLGSLKEAGYEIHLLLCGAEDELRAKAVDHRSTTQAFYQVTAADVLNKGLLFPQRMPVYFTFADKLTVYWSSDLLSTLERAAEVVRGHSMRVMNAPNYQLFINQYEKDRVKEGTLPSWAELIGSFK